MNKEAYRKPKKASRKQQKNPEIISLLFWDKLILHKDIIKSTDLYNLQIQKRNSFHRNYSGRYGTYTLYALQINIGKWKTINW